MSGYIVSPKADEDILEVWGYLYERAGIEVANHVEAEIYSAFETLARNPRIGHKRSDLTSHPVLFFAVVFVFDRLSPWQASGHRTCAAREARSPSNLRGTLIEGGRKADASRFERGDGTRPAG